MEGLGLHNDSSSVATKTPQKEGPSFGRGALCADAMVRISNTRSSESIFTFTYRDL